MKIFLQKSPVPVKALWRSEKYSSVESRFNCQPATWQGTPTPNAPRPNTAPARRNQNTQRKSFKKVLQFLFISFPESVVQITTVSFFNSPKEKLISSLKMRRAPGGLKTESNDLSRSRTFIKRNRKKKSLNNSMIWKSEAQFQNSEYS